MEGFPLVELDNGMISHLIPSNREYESEAGRRQRHLSAETGSAKQQQQQQQQQQQPKKVTSGRIGFDWI